MHTKNLNRLHFVLLILLCFFSAGHSKECELSNSFIKNCNVTTDKENFDFSGKKLKNVNLKNISLLGSIFSKTKLINVSFEGSNLYGSYFVEAELNNINFDKTDISESDFTGVKLIKTDFSNAVKDNIIFAGMKEEQPNILTFKDCRLKVNVSEKLSWASLIALLTVKGLSDPENFILKLLCEKHQGNSFELLSLDSNSSNSLKYKITDGKCKFNLDLRTDTENAYLESDYNKRCVTQNSSSKSTSHCYAIYNSNLQKSCIAKAKNNDSYCFAISNDSDMTNGCLATIKNDYNRCFSIKNQDALNSCLAVTKNDSMYCHTINNVDIKYHCLAITKGNKSNCYAINNRDVMNSCLSNF